MSGTPDAMVDPVKQLAKSWGWFLLYGVILIVLGLIALSEPKDTAGAVAMFFGIAMIVVGVFDIIGAIGSDEEGSRWPGVFGGILALILGIVVLRNIHESVAFIGLILGIFWLARGVLMIVSGFTVRDLPGRGWRILGGLVFTVLGAFVLGYPTTGPALIIWILGLLFVLAGILEVMAAFSVRAAANKG